MERGLMPLRMIRIVKDYNLEQMANHFEVTLAYISAVEKGIKQMHFRTLKYGLDNLGISMNDYEDLNSFSQEMDSLEMEYKDKFKFTMIKTMSVVYPELKEKTEELLKTYLYVKNK